MKFDGASKENEMHHVNVDEFIG